MDSSVWNTSKSTSAPRCRLHTFSFHSQREVGTPLYIKQIFAGSAADRCGKLQVGDELVSVNGERVVGRTPTALRAVIVGPQGSYCRYAVKWDPLYNVLDSGVLFSRRKTGAEIVLPISVLMKFGFICVFFYY